MYRLNRWATVNEIAKWADGMSWNTANFVLSRLYRKQALSVKTVNERRYWMIRKDLG